MTLCSKIYTNSNHCSLVWVSGCMRMNLLLLFSCFSLFSSFAGNWINWTELITPLVWSLIYKELQTYQLLLPNIYFVVFMHFLFFTNAFQFSNAIVFGTDSHMVICLCSLSFEHVDIEFSLTEYLLFDSII